MPMNAMTTGLAQNMANSSFQNQVANAAPGSNMAAFQNTTPWGSPKLAMAANAPFPSSTQYAPSAPANSFFVQGGPQGSGYYQAPSQTEALQGAQQYFANQFQQNIPTLENQMYSNLAQGVNANMNQGIQSARASNAGRGLLYGGVNAANEQAIRANASNQLAQGRQNINTSVLNEGQQLMNNAVSTGIGIQQQQQQMQNAVYQQAMASMNAQNQAIGGLLSAGGLIGAAALI